MPLHIIDNLDSFEKLISFITESMAWVAEKNEDEELSLYKYIFRGVSKSSFELVPSIGREAVHERAKNYYEELGDKFCFDHLISNLGDELMANEDWKNESDEEKLKMLRKRWAGYSKELKINYIMWDFEVNLLYGFKHYAYSQLANEIDDPWYLATVAQHYGVPTRFLDWSFSPLVAMYFAIIDDQETEGAIYVVNSEEFRNIRGEMVKKMSPPFMLAEICLFHPKPYDSRIENQESVFTSCNFPYLDLADNKLQEMEMDSYKLIISSDKKKDYMLKLQMLGISHDRIFPGLEGAAKRIKFEILGP